jgi:hypothetical protein
MIDIIYSYLDRQIQNIFHLHYISINEYNIKLNYYVSQIGTKK